MLMKNLVQIVLCAVFLLTGVLAQTVPAANNSVNPQISGVAELKDREKASLCNDSRPEVSAFCDLLADFQDAVNAGKRTEAELRGPLNNLDLKHTRASFEFITVQIVSLKTLASTALRDAGHARPDQQLSASNNASGTTSLVSRPGSADLLGLALDAGVLTRSVSGTTATLSTNADQIFRLVTGNDPDCTVTCKSLGWFENRVLNPTTISASLDMAQSNNKVIPTSGQASGTATAPVSSATIPSGAGKLSGITARYRVLNPFDPRTDSFKNKWKQAVKSSAGLKSTVEQVGAATDKVKNILVAKATEVDSTQLDKFVKAATEDRTGKKLANEFAAYFSTASKAPLQDPDMNDAIAKVAQARALFRQAWFQALENAVGNLFTLEYNYNRPQNQPMTHDFKLVYSYNFKTTGMVTFNGALSLYGGAIPAGANYGRTHYGQVSAEYDRTISGNQKDLQTQLSLAGYWQYQPQSSILNIPAGTVAPGTNIPLPNGTQEFVGTAGSLWVTQAKLTIKGAGGINIPIGVSWSNKTDLLQGSKVGAQVGITYNFASVANLFGGSGATQ